MKTLYAQYLKFQNDVNGNSRPGRDTLEVTRI
jgi:hypothetical protein